jgi:superfamily II DNA/RNA helicase
MMEISQAMIYCNSKKILDKLTEDMIRNGFSVSYLHGEMQEQDRERVMKDFRQGLTRVLISSDATLRGKDVFQVNLIINYDLPSEVETYMQRVGRSGHFGRKGAAINFIIPEDKDMLIKIQSFYNTVILELPSDLSQIN